MRVLNLTLVTALLACLIYPARSIAQDAKSQPLGEAVRDSEPTDFNKKIYYKNKLEFSLVRDGMASQQYPVYFRFSLRQWFYDDRAQLHAGTQHCFSPMANGQHRRSFDSTRQLGSFVQRRCHYDSEGT